MQQDYSSAIQTFKKITKLNPDYSTAWYNIACCYALQKNIKEVIAALQKAYEIDPQGTIMSAKEDSDFEILNREADFIALLKTQNNSDID